MLDMDQAVLAAAANVSRNTVVDFEKGRRTPNPNNLAAIRATLEAAGVVFQADGEMVDGGVGVRLAKEPAGQRRAENLNAANDGEEASNEAESGTGRGEGRQ